MDRGALGSYSLLGNRVSPPLTSPPPQGGVQPDYASQWAQYYRSQGMAREAEMIETYVRGKERGERESRQSFGRAPSPPAREGGGGGAGYGTSECYRWGRSHLR